MHKVGARQKETAIIRRVFGDKSSVHQKILLSCILLILLNCATTLFLINSGSESEASPCIVPSASATLSSIEEAMHENAHAQFRPHQKNNILVLASCSIGSLIFMMFFFLKSIANPLQEMEKTTRKLADGDLDQLMPIQADDNDPIGKIGENVHELAINLQEILLLVWNFSEQDQDVLKRTITMVKNDKQKDLREKILQNLEFLKLHREDMQNLVQQFELFHVKLQGKKLLAKTDTANL